MLSDCELREVAVTLKRRDEQRQERLEPFPADPVGGLPQHDERLTHGLIVDRKTRSPAQPAAGAALNSRMRCLRW